MKTTLSIILFLLGFGAVEAQTKPAQAQQNQLLSAKPIFIVFANNKEVKRMPYADSASISVLDPQDIESITVLKDSSATKKYGDLALNGAVEVYLKDGRTLKTPTPAIKSKN
jgi:hypothetical protein